MAETLIRGTVVTASDVPKDGWIAISGERIDAVGQGAAPPAELALDYGTSFVLPGLVDGHMHTSSAVGWPGIEGSTRSAAAGGVTTCVDMPYDVPQAVTDADVLADRAHRLRRVGRWPGRSPAAAIWRVRALSAAGSRPGPVPYGSTATGRGRRCPRTR